MSTDDIISPSLKKSSNLNISSNIEVYTELHKSDRHYDSKNNLNTFSKYKCYVTC